MLRLKWSGEDLPYICNVPQSLARTQDFLSLLRLPVPHATAQQVMPFSTLRFNLAGDMAASFECFMDHRQFCCGTGNLGIPMWKSCRLVAPFKGGSTIVPALHEPDDV